MGGSSVSPLRTHHGFRTLNVRVRLGGTDAGTMPDDEGKPGGGNGDITIGVSTAVTLGIDSGDSVGVTFDDFDRV